MTNRLLTFLVILCFLSIFDLSAQSIWVGIHDDVMTSETASVFSGGVTTFTPTNLNSKLKTADLNAALALGDVVLDCPDGNILFTPGTFAPQTGGRTMFLNAGGSISPAILTGSTEEISINACAGTDVNITGTGLFLNGGNLQVTGVNISVGRGGVTTGGGSISFLAQSNISIGGLAVRTQGGNFSGQGATLTAFGIDLRGMGDTGNLLLNFTGNISFNGPGIFAKNMELHGNDLLSSNPTNRIEGLSPGVDGNVLINLTGNLSISGGGLHVNGPFSSFGQNVSLSGAGIRTSGADLNMCHTGNVTITGSGIYTFLPDLTVAGGDVSIHTTGFLSVNSGGGIFTGYAYENGNTSNSEGGDVEVRADSIYLTGGSINTGVKRRNPMAPFGYMPGAGVLTTVPPIGTPSSILVENDGGGYSMNLIPSDPFFRSLGPYVGGGDVTLDVVNAPTCTPPTPPEIITAGFCLPFMAIPTMGTWALIALSILFLVVGVIAIRKTALA